MHRRLGGRRRKLRDDRGGNAAHKQTHGTRGRAGLRVLLVALAAFAAVSAIGGAASATTYYWRSTGTGNWSTVANWNTAQNGSGTSAVPGSADVATFTSTKVGNCTIDVPVNVLGMAIQNGYTGAISQGTNLISVGTTGWVQAGGTFTGGSAPIYTSDLTLSSTASFTSTSAQLNVSGNFSATGTNFVHNSGTVLMTGTSAKTVTDATTSPFYNVRFEDPSETGLLYYFKFDEQSGTTTRDSSGSGATATLASTSGSPPAWSTTVPSTTTPLFDNRGSLSFDGSANGQRVTYATANYSTLTYSAWIYYSGASTTTIPRILTHASGYRLGLCRKTSGLGSGEYTNAIQFVSDHAATAGIWSTPTNSINANTWYHVAVTYDGTSTANVPHIYINGVDQTVTTVTPSGARTANSGTAYIGSQSTLTEPWQGNLDDVRVYNQVLTASQVALLAAGKYAGSGGTITYTLGAALAADGDLAIDSGTLDPSTSLYALSVKGSWKNYASFTFRAGTVTLNGTGTSNSLITNGSHFNNLTVSAAGTWTMGDALNVDGTLTMSTGTIDQSSGNYDINAATVTKSGGTLTGGGNLVLNSGSASNLTLNSAGVAAVKVGSQSTLGLTAYWKLDENAGTSLTDSSGNGNTGTLHGGMGWVNTSLPTLQFSNTSALTFPGTTGAYVSLGTTNLPANNAAQTISLWCKYSSTTNNQNMVALVNSGSTSAVQVGLRSGVLLAWKWGGAALASVTAPTDGNWHHLAYTFDGTTHTLYVDGVSGSVTTTAPQTATPNAAYLGTYDGGSELYTGQLDDVRIYNRALSAAEVSGLAAGSYYDRLTGATYTLAAAMATTGDLQILGGALDASASNYGITVGGSWTNYGGFTARSGTVTFNGSSSSSTIVSSRYHFNNLTFSGTGTWTLGDRLWVDSALTMSSGTLNQSTSNYNVTASTVNQSGGTLTGSGSLIVQSRANSTLTLANNAIKTLRIESTAETNLVGYWKGDAGRGTTLTDYSGQGNDGTFHSTATWYNASLPGIGFDNYSAISLDGATGYISLNSLTNIPANNASQTVAFWAKLGNTGATQSVVTLANPGSSSGLQVGLTGGTVGARKWGGTTLVSTTAPTDGLWHHVAYTWDGTTHSIYLDGVATTSTAQAPQTATPSVGYISSYDGTNEMYNGQLDDIRIYKTALTSTQIAGLAAGRYSGVGGGGVFTLGAALAVPGTLAIDNGTLATSSYAVNAASTDSSQVSYVNGGTLQVDSGIVTFNGGLVVQTQGTVTETTSSANIRPGTGKTISYYDTAGSIQGFPTASFDWTTYSFWREYVVYRTFSGTVDRLLARSVDGGPKYYWDLPAGHGSLLGTPRWNMEGSNHYVYLITTTGYVYKVQDTGAAFSTTAGWPYHNGASASATSPLANDNSNLYWCGNDGTGAKKMFSLTLAGVLNNTRTVTSDVSAAPSLATISAVNYLFVATTNKVYRTPLDVSSELTSTQPTTTVNGRVLSGGGNIFFPENNGTVWGLSGSTLGTSWSAQDTDSTRHPGGCTGAYPTQCTVSNIYYDPAYGGVYYGDYDGHLYVHESGFTWTAWRPGTSSDHFVTAPLYNSGVIMIGAANGNVYEIDRNNGSGPALTRTYTLPAAVSSISYNPSANGGSGAYTVGTSDGKLFFIVAGTDPTLPFR